MGDNPRERANIGIEEVEKSQWIVSADDLVIPESGPIPITMCIDPNFPFTNDGNYTHVMWRTVKPTRQQSDFGPKEWVAEDWMMTNFENQTMGNCSLGNNETGDLIVANVPVPDDFSGKLHYKSMLGTRSGTFPFSYPAPGIYEEINIAYRAPFGNPVMAFLLFFVVVSAVWGGLGLALKIMMDSGNDEPQLGKKEEQG